MTLLKSNYSKNNYSNIIHEAATTQAIFKFTCGYRTLYTCTKRLEKKIFAPEVRFFLGFLGNFGTLAQKFPPLLGGHR